MRCSSVGLFVLLCLAPAACSKALDGGAGTASSSAPVIKAPVASASEAPSAPPSVAASAVADKPRPRRARGVGPSSMFFRAARGLALDDAQKAKIEQLGTALRDGAGVGRAQQALDADLAAGIKAGKLDEAKLDVDRAAVEKALAARLAQEADALDGLHAALKPEQRKALVADLRAQLKKRADGIDHKNEHENEHKDDHKNAHENEHEGEPRKDKGGPPAQGPAGKGPPPGFGIGRFLRGLDLDAEQRKKVDALLARPASKPGSPSDEWKKRHEALLEAFEKDGFDAKKFAPFDGKGPMVDRATMDLKLVGQLLPILSLEQRDKLAERVVRRAGGVGHHGPHAGPRPGHLGPDGDHDEDEDDDEKNGKVETKGAPETK